MKDHTLGHAVSLIAGLLDALDGSCSGDPLERLLIEAEAFRREHWEARNEYWEAQR